MSSGPSRVRWPAHCGIPPPHSPIATLGHLLQPDGMRVSHLSSSLAVAALTVVMCSCEKAPAPASPVPPPAPVTEPSKPVLDEAQKKMFQALPENFGTATEARVTLGRTLFHDVRLSAGAGFVVAVCGDIMTMPGLPRVPAANSITLNDLGGIEGLF